MNSYLVKAPIHNPRSPKFVLKAQKTMYGGKRIAKGDVVYVFASEHHGGAGLVARGTVTSARAIPRKPGVRQTPLVSIVVRREARARRPMGRDVLKNFRNWGDGRPETELNFKFYRQATNKIGGISAAAARFLDRCCTRT
jgi:hypothetical protein